MSSVVARLVPVLAGEPPSEAVKPVEIRIGTTSIGRSSGNRLVLTDPEVSKRHAELLRRGNEVTLRDLNSSNGSLVNGLAVREHQLQPGDILEFGRHAFVYEVEAGGEDDVVARSAVEILPQQPNEQTLVLTARDLQAEFPRTATIKQRELSATYERLRLAFAAIQELVEIRQIAPLCDKILDVALRIVAAEDAVVLLFDDSGELVPWATRAAERDEAMVISRTIVDEVINNKRAVLAADAVADKRWSSSESLVLSGMRSLVCVPLLNAEKVFGILHLSSASQTSIFSESDLDLLTGVATGAGVALSNAFLAHRLATEERHRESLGRFLAPQLVEQLLAQKSQLDRSGDERQVTVLFADIRGFTALTERSPATAVVDLLNEYFERMTEVVFTHRGLLDKFIGDAVMAVWGTPTSDEHDAERALRAAQDMQGQLRALNLLRSSRGEEPIGMGVGLGTGLCVAGAIGARRRLEYTVIGDAVNIAARLAGLAKAEEILLDEATFVAAGRPANAEALPETTVKGRRGTVQAHRITAATGPVTSPVDTARV